MARRKQGRAISGWIALDKPAGLTSTAAVNRVRRALNARKAGHAGTLDPAATGILPIALGEATKTVPVVAEGMKSYLFSVTWGAETNTDDAEGTPVRTSDLRPEPEAIRLALSAFEGDILQVPPAFSAVKIDGVRSYVMARAGETTDLAPRPLFVERLDLIDTPDPDHATLRMVCGKGGYVRSIARDLGQSLGCLGHVQWLRRDATGPFTVDGAVSLDTVMAAEGDPEADPGFLLPVEAALRDLPEARLSEPAVARVRNGNPAEVLSTTAGFGDLAWASFGGKAIALGRYKAGMFHPDRVIHP